MPRNRQERDQRERKIRIGVMSGCVGLGLIGVVACGYGHAAISTKLQISGEAVIRMSEITEMQQMTPDICKSYSVGTERQLVDRRDGKKYWIARQKDGKCWMTQNLAFDLSTTKTLTSTDTDLPSGVTYTPTSTTNAVAYTGTTSSPGANGQYSWSAVPGNKNALVVMLAPDYAKVCTTYSTAGNAAKSTDNIGSTCRKVGFMDVTTGWQPTFSVQKGTLGYNSSTNVVTATPSSSGTYLIAANTTAKTYDAHYLLGNYYQFAAANAGATGGGGGRSICPKGWMLPATLGATSDYAALIASGGYAAISDSSSAALRHTVGQDELAAKPFYFIRSGNINLSTGYLRNAGTNGFYWTSKQRDSTYAYSFRLLDTTVQPAYWDYRYMGVSLRCVAR